MHIFLIFSFLSSRIFVLFLSIRLTYSFSAHSRTDVIPRLLVEVDSCPSHSRLAGIRGKSRRLIRSKFQGFFWCFFFFFFWFCSAVGFFFVLSLSGSHFLLRRARGSTPGTAQSALRCIAGASCTGHGLDHPVIIQRPHHNSNAVEVSGSRHQGSGSATRRE